MRLIRRSRRAARRLAPLDARQLYVDARGSNGTLERTAFGVYSAFGVGAPASLAHVVTRGAITSARAGSELRLLARLDDHGHHTRERAMQSRPHPVGGCRFARAPCGGRDVDTAL